jgi:thiol-disulfide isomerase/thioredoxin
LIRHILRKDWRLLWPMVALVTVIQAAFEWVGYFQDTPSAVVLLRPLILAWHIGIAALAAAAVLQDPVPGADQDWLIRPLKRKDVILAKLAFVALAVCVPMLVLNLAHAMALGSPLARSLGLILFKELYVFACFILPVMALASATRNMTEVILVGVILVIAYALSLTVGAYFMGAEWCPTCDTGISWLQHVMQHVEILFGAGAIVVLQYYRRRTDIARALAVLGALALVFVQLPWNAAFAVQAWLTGSSGAAAAISLEAGPRTPGAETTENAGADKDHGARHAATLLLQGHPDQALEYWRRRGGPAAAPVAMELPVRAPAWPRTNCYWWIGWRSDCSATTTACSIGGRMPTYRRWYSRLSRATQATHQVLPMWPWMFPATSMEGWGHARYGCRWTIR